MNFRNLGIVMGCLDSDVDPREFHKMAGIAASLSKNPGPVGRLIASAACDILTATGRGNTAPARHLQLISKQANWSPQYQEAVNCVLETVRILRPMEKRAFGGADLTGALGGAVKGVGYGSLLGGSALGALYWLLNRHATQDDSDIEGMQHQIDYYDQLSTELEDSMRRKYKYEQPTPGKTPSR